MCDETGRLKLTDYDSVPLFGWCAYVDVDTKKSGRLSLWLYQKSSGIGFRPTWKVT